jgi:hypothetical protein
VTIWQIRMGSEKQIRQYSMNRQGMADLQNYQWGNLKAVRNKMAHCFKKKATVMVQTSYDFFLI